LSAFVLINADKSIRIITNGYLSWQFVVFFAQQG